MRLFFIYLCILPTISVSNSEEFFLRGNKYYEEKNYKKAFQAYTMIDKKGRAVLYNMGNCLFNQEDYIGALAYWSRAEMGARGQQCSDILHNKELALKKLGKQKEQSWWQKNSESIKIKLPYVSWLFLQILLLLCWWILFWVVRKKQKRFRKSAQGILCFCIMIVAIVLSRYLEQQENLGIVIKKDAHIFAGPNKNFHVLSPIEYANYVHIKEAREGWYKIECAQMIGWIEDDVIQVI